jgi:hypothetical protein
MPVCLWIKVLAAKHGSGKNMIKEIVLNGKKLPVPVPVREISELLQWISSTLLSQEHVLTRIKVDGADIDLDDIAEGTYRLGAKTHPKIEIRIDSPIDLTIQTVDALRNLATIIQPSLKPVAVECWGLAPKNHPKELENIVSDVELLSDLLVNASSTIDAHKIGTPGLDEFVAIVREFTLAINAARSQSDWKACAKILLNRLEPALEKLINTTIVIQNELFQIKSKSLLNIGDIKRSKYQPQTGRLTER